MISKESTVAEATKACPYCARQILSAAITCKHCGTALAAGPPPKAPGGVNLLLLPVRPALVVPAIVVVLVALVGGIMGTWIEQTRTISGGGFTDKDVSNIENDIRARLSDRGTKVIDVQLTRESPTRLTGLANLRVLGIPVNKTCTVTIGKDRQSIWRCK